VSATATPAEKIWTEAELQALPEDGFIHEVVNGQLVMSPKNTFYHGDICSRLLAALVNFNEAHRLGAVLDSSTGFWMSSSVAAFVLFLVFALFFRGGGMIRNREPDLQSEKMLVDRE